MKVPAHWTLDVVQHWDLSRAWQLSLSVHNLLDCVAWVPLDSTGRLIPQHPQDTHALGRQVRLQAHYRF